MTLNLKIGRLHYHLIEQTGAVIPQTKKKSQNKVLIRSQK
jgi:hypothetical protein